MRIFYLLLLLVSLTEVLNARDDVFRGKNVGDVVKGKNAAYRIVDKYLNYFVLVRNVNDRDTVQREEEVFLSERVDSLMDVIVYEQLTPKELSRFMKRSKRVVAPSGALIIYCLMDEDFKVKEVIFSFGNDSSFWLDLPVDRFYEIEKRLKELQLTPAERENLDLTKNDVYTKCFSGHVSDIGLEAVRKAKSRAPGENK